MENSSLELAQQVPMTSEEAKEQRLALKAIPMTHGIIPRNVGELMDLGNMYHRSGMFKDLGSAAIAIVKISIGAEFGFSPAASIMGIHIVQGKPMLGYTMIGAIIKHSKDYDYRVLEISDTAVELEFLSHGVSLGTERFTLEDAKRQGTQNIGKFPRNMLMARALSNGAKFFCPDVFGGTPVYTEGELLEPEDAPALPQGAAPRLAAKLERVASDIEIHDPNREEEYTGPAVTEDQEALIP